MVILYVHLVFVSTQHPWGGFSFSFLILHSLHVAWFFMLMCFIATAGSTPRIVLCCQVKLYYHLYLLCDVNVPTEIWSVCVNACNYAGPRWLFQKLRNNTACVCMCVCVNKLITNIY